jgi:hypothetical protein
VPDYKFAEYFERKVLPKRLYLRKEWCTCLRVITLADKVTILNAFPDRGFTP